MAVTNPTTVKPDPNSPGATVKNSDPFLAQILVGIGAPVTPTNLNLLKAWQTAEGSTSAYNPFNTTQRVAVPGVTDYNSTGVKNYPDPQTGVTATVSTLLNGKYGPVVAGLRAQSPDAFVAGLVASPWAGSGYGGRGTGKTYKDSTVWQRFEGLQTYGKPTGAGGANGIPAVIYDPTTWHFGGAPSVQETVQSVQDTVKDTAQSVSGFIKIVSSGDWWLRFGEMVAGVVILLWGFLFMIGKTDAAKAALSTVVKTTKVAAL
jgi:hypothetical protein